jgi:hypothetical protein
MYQNRELVSITARTRCLARIERHYLSIRARHLAIREGRIVGVEVKSGNARRRLSRSARSFVDAYRPPVFVVVSRQSDEKQMVGDTRVVYCRPWEVAEVTDEGLSE